jgi:hypothetical protein
LDITLKVARAPGFTQPLEVTFPALPPGVEAPTSVVVPADKSEMNVTLQAHPTAEVGNWRLIVEAKPARAAPARRDPLATGTTMGGRRRQRGLDSPVLVASEALPLAVGEPALKGQFAPAWGEQGKAVTVVCRFASPLTGEVPAVAQLEGLPPRAQAPPVEVAIGARQVAFKVTLDPTTPPGECRVLVCALHRDVDGRKVVYHVGRGGCLKVEAAGTVKTDANGKPLSPLDALRQQQKQDAPKKP